MTGRARLTAPPPPPRTFDEAFAEHNLTPQERLALVWHLAAIRTRKLVEELGPVPKIDPRAHGMRLTPRQIERRDTDG